ASSSAWRTWGVDIGGLRIARRLSSGGMEESLGRRLAGSLSAVVVGLALLAGLWLLPDLTPDEAIPVIGQESLHGRIVESLGTDASGLPLFVVEVLDGPTAGERIEAAVQGAGAA